MAVRLVVGLGNPGFRYVGTRHNLGFQVVERLVRRAGGRWRVRGPGREAEALGVCLLEPLTYMNLSGVAVREAARRRGVSPEEILVVCDDLDLPLGRLRLRAAGGAGGHRGLASLIQELGSREFPRLRLGIGRPAQWEDPAAYVLSGFPLRERRVVERMLGAACEAVEVAVRDGIGPAMNRINAPEAAEGGEGP
ncbi:MAG: aminoacyl-tRNA hydrolase [Thermaerobacter sp.]|nr:aminoacyl-tRNA hydrolase [Thermaerobacter sp.]